MDSIDLRVPELGDDEALASRLWRRLVDKHKRNALRTSYYDARQAFQQMGITDLPGRVASAINVVGWPAKAVDTLNSRCHLDGFVMPGDDEDSLGVGDIWSQNHLANQAPQVGLSSLIHAVSWLIVTRGGPGEPDALVTSRDALTGTGEWNYRTHRLNNFLSVLETDTDGHPLAFALYLPDEIVEASRDAKGLPWSIDRRQHDIGYVPVEPLIHKPRLGRPFGSSRITRPVMSYTNAAMRTLLRSEVTAELYSVPQRVILGADQSMFLDAAGQPTNAWDVVWGKILGIPENEDGNVPKFEQLSQATQEPHMAQLRTLAQLFSGETSIPVTELGIHADSNPASAEAVYAHQGSLISTAEMTTDGWEPAWRRTMLTALKVSQGESEIPAEWQALRARFRNPAYESKAAAADAGLKMVQAFPWLAETDVGLELFVRDEIMLERLKAERRRMNARSTASALALLAGNSADADQ